MRCRLRDKEYKFRDFLKVSLLEGLIGVPLSAGVSVVSFISGANPLDSLTYGCASQGLIYLGTRTLELVGRCKSKNSELYSIATAIRKTKIPVRYIETDRGVQF